MGTAKLVPAARSTTVARVPADPSGTNKANRPLRLKPACPAEVRKTAPFPSATLAWNFPVTTPEKATTPPSPLALGQPSG